MLFCVHKRETKTLLDNISIVLFHYLLPSFMILCSKSVKKVGVRFNVLISSEI